jgi:hypothetical protein
MPLTSHQGDMGGRAVPDHRTPQDPGRTADAGGDEQDMFDRVMEEIGRLREENDDLRCRVRRLEARSGRGIMHPSEFTDGMSPRSA